MAKSLPDLPQVIDRLNWAHGLRDKLKNTQWNGMSVGTKNENEKQLEKVLAALSET